MRSNIIPANVVDLEGPDGGRFWLVTSGQTADHRDGGK